MREVVIIRVNFFTLLPFSALHPMHTRSSDEKAVRPSVCLSVRLSVCETRGL